MVTLTLIVAGCSLAVAVGGGLVDRKRPFTLLRVSGVPVSALSRVVLMEAALPPRTVIAAGRSGWRPPGCGRTGPPPCG